MDRKKFEQAAAISFHEKTPPVKMFNHLAINLGASKSGELISKSRKKSKLDLLEQLLEYLKNKFATSAVIFVNTNQELQHLKDELENECKIYFEEGVYSKGNGIYIDQYSDEINKLLDTVLSEWSKEKRRGQYLVVP